MNEGAAFLILVFFIGCLLGSGLTLVYASSQLEKLRKMLK